MFILSSALFKGSGTVLYRSDNHILVLTAYHNLYQKRSSNSAFNIRQMRVLEDNRDEQHKDIVLAEMADDNYIQVGQKDIALVALELRNEADFFEDNRIIHGILDFRNTQRSGKNNSVQVQINQYPDSFDWYIKTNGTAYHDDSKGYHYIPTLPGASGSGIVVDNNVIGVHVSSGIRVPLDVRNIQYNNRDLLVENNIFELISMDEIEQVSTRINNVNDRIILADLIRRYVNSMDRRIREELISYLEHGRKIKNDKDTNPEFLKAINKLNEKKKFWTSLFGWPKKIEEITDKVVDAYNAKVSHSIKEDL